MLDLAINVSKSYQPPNRKLIFKDPLYVIHDHNGKELEFDQKRF